MEVVFLLMGNLKEVMYSAISLRYDFLMISSICSLWSTAYCSRLWLLSMILMVLLLTLSMLGAKVSSLMYSNLDLLVKLLTRSRFTCWMLFLLMRLSRTPSVMMAWLSELTLLSGSLERAWEMSYL